MNEIVFSIDLSIDDAFGFDMQFEDVQEVLVGIDSEYYEGSYEVTPTVDGVTLETARKTMSRDLTINPIPYYDTGNESGGRTIYIAKTIE